MTIKAILIDIDNTILDFNKSAKASIDACASEFNISFPVNYFDVFIKINDFLWGELENGSITKQELYKKRWKMIFEELDITADANAFEEMFRQQMRNTAIPVDGAQELLSYLYEKYDLYTASNASLLQQQTRLNSTGFNKYINGMFTSEELGFQKPSKEFFALCCKELYPIKKSELIVIGDSVNADIIGAKNFGLKTIWFNYNHITYDNYSFTDYYVDKLSDIRDIL